MNNTGWFGESKVKFYMDGDREFPTIMRKGNQGLFRQSDIASTAFWHHAEPHAAFLVLPGNDDREVI